MNESFPAKGRIAGVDYGTVRIGVAISDPGQSIASPLENYTRRDETQDARWFAQLVEQEEIVLFVIGLPLHMDGRESEKSSEARRFGEWLTATTGVPIEFFDERLTSHEAEQILLGAEMTNKRRKKRLDMLAAQIILRGYLERKQSVNDELNEQ